MWMMESQADNLSNCFSADFDAASLKFLLFFPVGAFGIHTAIFCQRSHQENRWNQIWKLNKFSNVSEDDYR